MSEGDNSAETQEHYIIDKKWKRCYNGKVHEKKKRKQFARR